MDMKRALDIINSEISKRKHLVDAAAYVSTLVNMEGHEKELTKSIKDQTKVLHDLNEDILATGAELIRQRENAKVTFEKQKAASDEQIKSLKEKTETEMGSISSELEEIKAKEKEYKKMLKNTLAKVSQKDEELNKLVDAIGKRKESLRKLIGD